LDYKKDLGGKGFNKEGIGFRNFWDPFGNGFQEFGLPFWRKKTRDLKQNFWDNFTTGGAIKREFGEPKKGANFSRFRVTRVLQEV